jgi:N-acetylglutamate synthase-like GNAT family acetyltransferase
MSGIRKIDAPRPGAARIDKQGDVTLAPTTDIRAIAAVGVAAGLEDAGRAGEQAEAGWLARDGSGCVVGAVALERWAGLDTVNWMAVDEAWRGHGVGSRLLAALEATARARGVTDLHVTARADGFFAANGYAELPDGVTARFLLGDCLTCPQYRKSCEPRPMVKQLKATEGVPKAGGEA